MHADSFAGLHCPARRKAYATWCLPGPLFHRLFLLMAFQMKSKEGHKTWEQRLPANLLIHQLAVREIQVPAGESVPGLLYLEEASVTNG